jgi:hypothetical protein
LTVDQEAALFRLLNNTRQVGAMDSFLKGVLALDPQCLAIDGIARRYGWSIALRDEAGCIAAVKALETVYRRDDGETLDAVLALVTAAWKFDDKSVEGPMLRGMAAFIAKNQEIDRSHLAAKLGKRTSPAQISSRAKFLAEGKVTSGTTSGVSYAVAEVWNVHRNVGRAVA